MFIVLVLEVILPSSLSKLSSHYRLVLDVFASIVTWTIQMVSTRFIVAILPPPPSRLALHESGLRGVLCMTGGAFCWYLPPDRPRVLHPVVLYGGWWMAKSRTMGPQWRHLTLIDLLQINTQEVLQINTCHKRTETGLICRRPLTVPSSDICYVFVPPIRTSSLDRVSLFL